MPKFLLIVRADEADDPTRMTPDDFARILADYQAWAERAGDRVTLTAKLEADGAVVTAAGEQTDGAFAEADRVVDSVYLVDADDVAHATQLCEGHPALRSGSIEVRAVEPHDPPAQA